MREDPTPGPETEVSAERCDDNKNSQRKPTGWVCLEGGTERPETAGSTNLGDLSLIIITVSEMRVIPNIVIIPATELGIASGFVLKVENLKQYIINEIK
jgi:hypothetical protein